MNPRRTVVVRVNAGNRNHHLFNNNGTWWMHWTEHLPDFTKRRVRVSLATKNLEVARARRDKRLAGKGGERRAGAGGQQEAGSRKPEAGSFDNWPAALAL